MKGKKKKKTAAPASTSFTKYFWWGIPVLALVIYFRCFTAGFTLDDIPIIEDNTHVHALDKLPTIWTSHYWAGKIDANDDGLYRPLTLTTYNLQYALTGSSSAPFHWVNMLLHALVCLVLMKFIHLVFSNEWVAWLTGLLFAIHPIHTEAVAGIVGRAELLSALFLITGSIAYHNSRSQFTIRWLLALVLSCIAAITSKEHGFMLLPILVLQEAYYFFTSRKYSWSGSARWISLGAVFLVSVILWLIRASITGSPVAHEMWFNISATTRMATAVRTTMEYVGLHLLPLKLSADYWTDQVPITGWSNPLVSISLLFLAGLIYVAVRFSKKLPVLSWGLLFFFLTLLPVSNFLFAAGFLKAERILYIPSIGLITAMSFGIWKLYEISRVKWPVLLFTGGLMMYYTLLTVVRTGDWKNNYTLAQATLKTSPNSPRFNNMMGLELRALKQRDEALAYFEKAVAGNPNHVPALVNLGTEYRNHGRHEEAAVTLEKALTLDPGNMAVYANLMSVYRSLNRHDENLEVAKKAVKRFPQSAAILWNAGNAYHLKGDMENAEKLRARAKAIDPGIGGNQ